MKIRFKTKKVTSLFLAFLMLLSSVFISATAEETDISVFLASDEFKFVKAFDLMPTCNYDDFRPDETISRAEFARILCALSSSEPSNGGNEFYDIDSNKYKDYISTVNTMGLMTGYDKYSFLPDKEITLNEVYKTFIVLLGYDVKAKAYGGYPTGYIKLVNELKLNIQIKASGTEAVKRSDIVRIIYNMRNVHCMVNTSVGDSIGYEVSEEDTFLTFYLGVDYVRGLLTDNGITSLRGDGAHSEKTIKIEDMLFRVNELNTTRSMIGRYVEAYFAVGDENESKDIKYIQLYDDFSEEITVFDIKDFLSLNSRTIRYEINDDKYKEIKLSNFAAIIYNGKAEKVITSDMFDYDYGTVTYIPAYRNNPDVIIIEGFLTWFVSSVDREFEFIKGDRSSRKIDNSLQLNLKNDDINRTVFIEDEHGLIGNINDIVRYCVIDISKNDEVMFIRVAPLVASDKQVKAIEKSDLETNIIFSDDEKVKVIPDYINSEDFKSVKTGSVYYVYKNSFGDIAALSFSEAIALKYGFIVGADAGQGLDAKGSIKVLDEKNIFHIYEVENKIKWSDENNNSSREEFSDIVSKLQTYDYGLINYSLNEEGKINTIYLPVKVGKEREMGRLGCAYDGDSGYYESGRRNIGKDVIIASSTSAIPMFKVYLSETNHEDKFASGTAATLPISRSSNSSVQLKAYNYEPYSKYGEILVQTHNSAASVSPTTADDFFVIRKMTQAMYKDELYIKMEGSTEFGAEKVLYVEEEDIKNVEDTMYNTSNTYTLKVGDIISYIPKQGDSSLVDGMFLWWRSDMEPVDSEGKGRRGFFPGNLGYFDAKNANISNPYKFNGGDGRGDWTAQYRSMAGYVYYVDSKGAFDVTTQDLSYQQYDASLQGWNNDNEGQTPYTQHAVVPHHGRFALVTYKDGNVYCREGKPEDVKSYIVDGNECSRIIFTSSYGAIYSVFVINGEMK